MDQTSDLCRVIYFSVWVDHRLQFLRLFLSWRLKNKLRLSVEVNCAEQKQIKIYINRTYILLSRINTNIFLITNTHCDLKVSKLSSSNRLKFSQLFLRATKKHKWVGTVKSKCKALRHFKVDPVLKIDGTFHKEAESMCTIMGPGVSHEKMSTFISLTCINWILHLPCVHGIFRYTYF